MAVADIILVGGRVWQGLAEGFAEALAISGDKVLAAGPRAEIEALAGPGTRRIDLAGRLAIPGINDAHMHLLPYGTTMTEVDLRPSAVKTMDEVLERIAERARELAPGQWVLARGYDDSKLAEKRHPHRRELDAAAPDNPVYAVRTCGHVAVANTKALELAGIGHNTPSPYGGLIERRDNELTGLLAETGREAVIDVLPELTVDDLVGSIERGGKDLLRYGITSVMEAAIGIRDGWTEMEAYRKAHRTGRLPVRVYGCLMGDKTRSILDKAVPEGLVTGVGDDMFRIGPVKIFTDGSAGGRTAAMTTPYLGTNDKGLLCLTDEDCEDLVMTTHRHGYQMAIHAIGDAAIAQVLAAYEKALAAEPAPGRRHRIEHCGWLSREQIAQMQRLEVIPAPQPSFIYYFGDLYNQVLGEERSAFSYPMRAFIEAGLHPSASTDCPVTEIDPFPVIYSMVTRKTDRGTVIGADQAMSLAEALHAYTYEAAYGAHDETRKGRLVPGQYADVAILSRDMFDGPPEAILETVCDMTVLGGEVVYERETALV
ncbi:amidohydrolase [Kaustia mangrovi]|uniref:Amidohydrolase n=1 Tax=Kaustia mangrovi TaxID=2593653 RepID=A0A7S8C4I5_9HYPH|nr:amidohydrolase [Kaustia mangrovi]QPC43255.1 amidohydrolase [Kaustia mangrovi]